MKITQSKEGAWTVLTLSGKIDHAGAEDLEVVLLPLMKGGAVALDFGAVDYITSSGFRVLMRAERDQDASKGQLLLGNMKTSVRYFFDTAGLSQHFKISDDIASVIRANAPARR
jgi:anti-sigma B factor antagonist